MVEKVRAIKRNIKYVKVPIATIVAPKKAWIDTKTLQIKKKKNDDTDTSR